MAIIGQAFSPAFLQLVTQGIEGDKNRNMQAAIADREFKLKHAAQVVGVKQQNIANRFEAQRLAASTTQGKAQLEIMKEEGRRSRQKDKLTVQKEIADGLLAQKQHAELSKAELRAAQAEGLLGKETRNIELFEYEKRLKAAAAALSEGEIKQQAQKIAIGEDQLENSKLEKGKRAKLMQAQIERYGQLIASGRYNDAFKAVSLELKAAYDEKNLLIGREKAFVAINKILSTFDEYNQSVEDRAKKDGTTSVAVGALIRLQKEWAAKFQNVGGNEKSPDIASRIKALLDPETAAQMFGEPAAPAGPPAAPATTTAVADATVPGLPPIDPMGVDAGPPAPSGMDRPPADRAMDVFGGG